MPIHLLNSGNLTTCKPSTWQFALPRFDLRFFAAIKWSYGTFYDVDTGEKPRPPKKWLAAGTRTTISRPIPFTLAAPYIVRVQWELLPVAQRPLEEIDPGESDDCLVREFVSIESLPAKEEKMIVVYPGLLVIEDAPLIFAQSTEGFLPILFNFKGLGPEVLISGKLLYQISSEGLIDLSADPKQPISKRFKFKSPLAKTTQFTANPAGKIDQWSRSQRNGSTNSYNFFIAPESLRSLRIDKNLPGTRQDLRISLSVNARPRVSTLPNGELPINLVQFFTTNLGKRVLVSDLPYLVHYERAGDNRFAKTGLSLCQRADRLGKAKTYRIIYADPLATKGYRETTYPPDHERPPRRYLEFLSTIRQGYSFSGELIRTADDSPEDGTDVRLFAELKDQTVRGGLGLVTLFYPEVSQARVEGARRAASVFQYYRLDRFTPPDVLKGQPVCLVGSDAVANGTTVIRLHQRHKEAEVNIFGKGQGNKLFDYAGLAASAATFIAGILTPGGPVLLIGGLTATAGIASVWWSYTPPANQTISKVSNCEAVISNVVTIADLDGKPRITGNRQLVNTPAEGTDLKNGKAMLDASFVFSHGTVVGDLINVGQLYSVNTSQQHEKEVNSGASIVKSGFDKALDVEAQ